VVAASLLLVAALASVAMLLLHQNVGNAQDRVPPVTPAAVTVDQGGGLRLCNKTTSRVGVAIGYKVNGDWVTEGWWNVGASACETLMAGPLVSRFYYVYAVDYDQGGAWGGKSVMCTRDKMFTIKGIEDCVARGYERTGFFEVDTGEQKSWTVQLTAPGETGNGSK